MYFLVKNTFDQNQHDKVREEIYNNKKFLIKKNNLDASGKEQIVFKISHNNLTNLRSLMDTIISQKITETLRQKFKKLFLINFFFGTINGYSVLKHRDGMGYEVKWKQKSYTAGEKIFKVINYFNEVNSHVLDISFLSSKSINFFNNNKLSYTLNNYYNYYIKKNFFFKNSQYKIGDTLIFDNNTWHGTSSSKKTNQNSLIDDSSSLKKIFVSYDVVVDDKNLANEYAQHQAERYNINTDYTTELNYLSNIKLNMFDEIINLKKRVI